MPSYQQPNIHQQAMRNNVEYLKNNKVNPDDLLLTFLGNTPLLWAVANSSVSFALALLDLPETFHVNVKSTIPSWGNTPLILSVAKGWSHVNTEKKDQNSQKELVLKLLQKGAEVNAVDAQGRSALHYACLHRNLEAIKTLVQAGAVWDIKDKKGQTPLDFCCLCLEMAKERLQIATGGPLNYTHTLEQDNFEKCSEFYHALVGILEEKTPELFDVATLELVYEHNKKIDAVLRPIFKHARILFSQYCPNHFFDDYANCVRDTCRVDSTCFDMIDSVGSRKLKALVTTYNELETNALAQVSGERISTEKREKIDQILTNALKNNDLLAERRLITQVGWALLNLVSILCAGLPFMINYYFNRQVFFSHQTKTESLIERFKEKVSSCTLL